MEPIPIYKSYLLRLWKVTQSGEVVWRASLKSAVTEEQQGFPDIESLFAYLTDSVDESQATVKRDDGDASAGASQRRITTGSSAGKGSPAKRRDTAAAAPRPLPTPNDTPTVVRG